MNWVITVYSALLFFVLTPGVLVTLPPKGKKLTVAAFHAVVFALVWHFTHKLVWRFTASLLGPVKEGAASMTAHDDAEASPSATTSALLGGSADHAVKKPKTA